MAKTKACCEIPGASMSLLCLRSHDNIAVSTIYDFTILDNINAFMLKYIHITHLRVQYRSRLYQMACCL